MKIITINWTTNISKIVWFTKQYIKNKTYESNLYRCATCLIHLSTYFCPNCFKFENQTLSQLKEWLKGKPKKSLSKTLTVHLTLTFHNYRYKKVTSRIRWGNGCNHVKCYNLEIFPSVKFIWEQHQHLEFVAVV